MMSNPLVLLLALVPLCAGHGSMNKPPSWLDPDGKFVWAAGMSGAGCTGAKFPVSEGCVMEWYSNYTFIPGEPTIPPLSPLLTYKDACMGGAGTAACCNAPCTTASAQGKGQPCEGCDWTRTHPWRAPGSAPVFSPCGFDGGNPKGCPVGNPSKHGCNGGGYGHGPDGRSLGGNSKPEIWYAGGEAEVVWGVTANHGGGYQYRLCPKPDDKMDLTEACFQNMPLRYVNDTQWLQKGPFTHTRVAIQAVRTDQDVIPSGSQWTRNPIPACLGGHGGSNNYSKCEGTQFPPPDEAPDSPVFSKSPYSIIDRVQVPVAPGDYVIQFRYDCEQTPQVWTQCGDVRIVDGPAPAPGPPTDQCHNPLCQSCCTGSCSVCKGTCENNKTGGCAGCWKESPHGPPCNLRGLACLADDKLSCEACWSSNPLPSNFPAVNAVKTLAAPPPQCDSCFTGGCRHCKGYCQKHKGGGCAACWPKAVSNGTYVPPCNLREHTCLADDQMACEACWKLLPQPQPEPEPEPQPAPAPAPPTDQCHNPLCQSCCTGSCSVCKGTCENKKTGECAACWKESPHGPPCNLRGMSCLADDKLSCEACWSSNPLPASFSAVNASKTLTLAPLECDSCFTGSCRFCRGYCEKHKGGGCAACWMAQARNGKYGPPCNLRGSTCLADDKMACEACWKLPRRLV